MLLSSERSVLVVVDVQERLMPAVHEWERVVNNAGVLLRTATQMGVPVVASEQYSKGLGPTVTAVRDLLPPGSIVEKIHFSAAYEPAFMDRLDSHGRDQIVLCGSEAHVCVMQTALGLRALGRTVFIVADATSSRNPANAEAGIARMRVNGVEVVTTEMVVFEWLHRADVPVFKSVLAHIK
ncbi:MAG TPA: isochorismatase family protein [Azospirillum sp.]|nr:isochorismatase family protein [Azospirillum sp.]